MRKKRIELFDRRTKVKRALFEYLNNLGYFILSAAAPDAPKRLSRMLKDLNWTKPNYYYAKTVVGKMVESGLLKKEIKAKGFKVVRLTDKGRVELQRYLSTWPGRKPRFWDGKYHLVIFDVKEWKRGVRNQIRQWLKELGFARLQQSVWVYPYPCHEIISLLKAKFKIGNEVLYIIAETIENDGWLRKEFSLK